MQETRRDQDFYKDKDLMQITKELSEEEVEEFRKMEHMMLYDNGLKWTSGGFAELSIVESDDEEEGKNFLTCRARCGTENEDGSSVDTWTVYFDRKNLRFSTYKPAEA